MAFERLNWDSAFFGFEVARITDPDIDIGELSSQLDELSGQGYKLVYFPARRKYSETEIAALNGIFVDEKTTFATDLADPEVERQARMGVCEPYSPTMAKLDMIRLAVQSGEYSRYTVDPKVPRKKFEELYSIWMERAIAKEIADEVLIIRDAARIAGMVTLEKTDSSGSIGLVAVDEAFRGRNYGERLVRAAQRWFIEAGCTRSTVVTQGANAPACGLYRKCGYKETEKRFFYHFWP